MKFVEEIVDERFLPTVRSLLAEELGERGLTQREIADAIGVSQSAVSKYVHGEVKRDAEVLADPRVHESIEELATGLADGRMDTVSALIELEVLIRRLEAPGELLATMHERAVPGLAEREGPFRIHDPDSRLRRRERVRSSVREALRHIEATPGFVRLLPQVGSNVVEILPDGDGIDDVAGVPGRIIDVEGRVEIPGEPRFGVSGHLAGVLLAARRGTGTANAAINIKYTSPLVDELSSYDLAISEVPGDVDIEETIEQRLRSDPDVQVIAQTGGFGIEPIVYVLAGDAPTAVAHVCRLVEE